MTTTQTVDKIIHAHHRHNLGKIDYRVLYVNIEDAVEEARREAYAQGYEDGYKRGQLAENDAEPFYTKDNDGVIHITP
jgi:hypothetical protein